MNAWESWAARVREALAHVKSDRNKVDRKLVNILGEARADEELIDLRKSLAYLAEIIDELPH